MMGIREDKIGGVLADCDAVRASSMAVDLGTIEPLLIPLD
jgi:hypothetical protein